MFAARRQFLQFSANAVAATAYASIAHAQAYPSRPITLIVPFPPGGSTDVVGRIVAERLRALLGQPVIIENVGGAGGSNGALYPLTYDLQKDLEPIGLLSTNPQLILGRKALPADDLKGLVAWLKANPDKATQAVQTPGGRCPAAGSHRRHQGFRGHVQDSFSGRARHSDRRRRRRARTLRRGMVRTVCPQGHAEGCRRQAQWRAGG